MTALQDRPDRTARRDAPPAPSRVRGLLTVALTPTVTVLAVLAAGVLVVLVASGVELAAAPGVVAAAWLGAHQVPLTIAGSTLGVLPLVPTLLLVWFTERTVVASGATGRACAGVLVAAVAGPLALSAVAVAVLGSARGLLPVTGPAVGPALLPVLAVHLLAAVVGLARPSGRLAQLRRAVPAWAWSGAVLVPRLLLALLGAGTVLVVLGLALSAGTVGELVGAGGGPGGGIGLVVLSLLYLPTVVVGAVSVLVGPGAVLGQTTVTAFGAVAGPVPPLPVLAVLPEGTGAWWWLLVLLVPAALGVALGVRCGRAGVGRREAVRAVLTAAGVTGVALGVLGAVSGGALGDGAFTPVGVPWLALAVTTAAWLGVVGTAVVLLADRVAGPEGEPVGGPEVALAARVSLVKAAAVHPPAGEEP